MINSLDMATISHFGIGKQSSMEIRRKAGMLFSRALSKGQRRSFWHKLIGRSNQLRNLAQIEAHASRQPTRHTGVVSVPLAKIVGSEGRVNDFDGAFNPLTDHIRDRWMGIAEARRRGIALPPVDLIQVSDEYYVRDGHHRISVAKAAGQGEIEAHILFELVG